MITVADAESVTQHSFTSETLEESIDGRVFMTGDHQMKIPTNTGSLASTGLHETLLTLITGPHWTLYRQTLIKFSRDSPTVVCHLHVVVGLMHR